MPINTPAGEQMFFELTLNPVVGDDGPGPVRRAYGHDVTSQRRAADFLTQAALIELSYEAIFVWDLEDASSSGTTGRKVIRLHAATRPSAGERRTARADPDRETLMRDRYCPVKWRI